MMTKIEKLSIVSSIIVFFSISSFPIAKYYGINLLAIIQENSLSDIIYGLISILALFSSYVFGIIGFIKNKEKWISIPFFVIVLSQILAITLFIELTFTGKDIFRIYLVPIISMLVFGLLTVIKVIRMKSCASPSGRSAQE